MMGQKSEVSSQRSVGNSLWVWLIVIFIRFPLMLLMFVMIKVGEAGLKGWNWLDTKLPGLNRREAR